MGLTHMCCLVAALPRALNGMNAKLMRDYVEYVADFLLVELGLSPLFGKRNPVHICAVADHTEAYSHRVHSFPSWRRLWSEVGQTSSSAE